MPLLRSLVRVTMATVVAAVAGCVAPTPSESLDELANRPLARIDGELEVPGLADPVEVVRDEWGIPHIDARNDEDLFFHDAYSLAAALDAPAFQGWTSADVDVEWARGLIAEWDATLTRDSVAAALYVRWDDEVDARARSSETPLSERRALLEQGLESALDRLTVELGPDRNDWRHGRLHASALPHMMTSAFDLPTVERPGGFGTLNATGANFRRIIDLADLDRSVASNSPGQSAQPGSPFYDNLVENLGNGEYFPLLYTRGAVEERAAHRLMLRPMAQ